MPIDYSQYPPNWLTEIRPRILQRANHRCEWCGVLNYAVIRRLKDIDQWQTIGAQDWDMIRAKVRSGYTESGAIKKLGLTKIILTIAHLNHDKSNWEVKDEELKAACQRCHLKYDHPRHIANRKYGRDREKNQNKLF